MLVILILLGLFWPKPETLAYSPTMAGEVLNETIDLKTLKQPKKDAVKRKVVRVVKKVNYTYKGGCRPVTDLLVAIGANYRETRVLTNIAREESGCNPKARNPQNGIFGIFQYTWATFHGHGCKRWGNYQNWQAQTRCALQDFRAGLATQWQVEWDGSVYRY